MPIATSDQKHSFISVVFIMLIEGSDFWKEQNE